MLDTICIVGVGADGCVGLADCNGKIGKDQAAEDDGEEVHDEVQRSVRLDLHFWIACCVWVCNDVFVDRVVREKMYGIGQFSENVCVPLACVDLAEPTSTGFERNRNLIMKTFQFHCQSSLHLMGCHIDYTTLRLLRLALLHFYTSNRKISQVRSLDPLNVLV